MNIVLSAPAQGEKLSLLTAEHRAFLSGSHLIQADNSLDWTNLKRKGTEKSYPAPVRFCWRVEGSGDCAPRAVRLHISDRPDFARERVIACDPAATQAEVYNLSADRAYYWKVVLTWQQGQMESPTGCFQTLDEAPTLYRVEGLTNVRDIGGWRTVDGRRVKRGLLFRGSEMDTHHELTQEGRRALKEELGIRTDLDLREEAVGKIASSPIGPDIRFELLPVKAYAEYMERDRFAECRRLFSLLADETAYPAYLHCWGGADRTGTVVLLLNALLGVDDESLLLDYEMTLFSVWGERSRNSELFQGLLAALNGYGGIDQPLRVKAERYLREAGVTDGIIGKIRALFLE